MSKKNIFSVLIFFVFIDLAGFSQTAFTAMKNPEAFKTKFNEISESTISIENDFIQNKNLSILAKPIVSEGKFYYKKENKVRWEYSEPYFYLIIIQGNKLYVKDKNNQKQYDTQSNKMFQELNKFLVGCINGDILNKTGNYKIEFKENNEQFYVILVPNDPKMKQMLNEIHIYFDKKNYSVVQLKMVEQDGDFTNIEFFNKKINGNISDEKFNFN
ncbi:MAG: cell envelope biogenesis protein LolA [Bacteroidetes bacterium CG23_combo_of_CG06-09_8_20_14_all_32_9]|nr:MAG: cell envelope biogenesis protein LolA [Bacteroidetes bacterium CG23_combo_of_CG06-09_8_20_14_all_32_9]